MLLDSQEVDQIYWLASNCVFDEYYFERRIFSSNLLIHMCFLLPQILCCAAAVVGIIKTATSPGEEGKGRVQFFTFISF